MFTILYHIWTEGHLKHRAYFEGGKDFIQILHTHFISLSNKMCFFETVQDQLRSILNCAKPEEYHYGLNYSDINQLVMDLNKSHVMSHLHCLNCNYSINILLRYFQDYTPIGWSSNDYAGLLQTASIQSYLNYKVFKKGERSNKFCPKCYCSLLYNTQYIEALPSILIFSLAPWIEINECLIFDVSNISKEYNLKGVIYSNRNHFTTRLIDDSLNVWFHDGQTTHSLCWREQSLMDKINPVSLRSFGEYHAILTFYVER